MNDHVLWGYLQSEEEVTNGAVARLEHVQGMHSSWLIATVNY